MAAGESKSFVVLLGFLATLLWSVSPAFGLEIRVIERAEVRGSNITLGEVAKFSDETDPRVEEIRKIVVAQAPPAGKVMILDGAYLNYRLSARLGQPDLNLVLPRQLEVGRQAQEINRADLERMFTQYVCHHMPWLPEQVRFSDFRAPEVISLPTGVLTSQIKTLGRRDYLGHVSLLVTLFVDGIRQRSVRISGQVDVMQEVVVAKKDLKRSQEIMAAMVALEVKNMVGVQATALTRISDAIGMQTRQPVRAGEVILPRMLKGKPLVQRGDRLILVAESANLKVETVAKALEDGYQGEQVRVVNSTSGKEVYGRVVGPRQVVVDF
jgi:flagella basal body P-ring formation protein FlgA